MFSFLCLLFITFLTISFLFLLDSKKILSLYFIKLIANIAAGCIFLLALFIWIDYNNVVFTSNSQILYTISYPIVFNIKLSLDILSIKFITLSAGLTFLCILYVTEYSNQQYLKLNYICLFLIELFLFLIFSAADIFLFYVMYEAILIPMYLVIGIWGSRERKIRAVFLFFFYTLVGSILFLVSLIYIYLTFGSFDITYITAIEFNETQQILLWICFFFSFASKIPMFPFHIWLPEAHVEAPTVGSVLLAGVLLKLGVYGFLRFNLVFFPMASTFFCPLVQILSLIGIIYASLCAIRQTDLKRIIAYSSVAHMNLVVLGIFSFNTFGYEGAIFQSLSHGFVSGGLFFLIGMIYYRYHTRFLYYYGGIVHMMPIYSLIFLIFTLANIALPGTSSFVGEFLLLLGIYKYNVIICIVSAIGVILCGAYSLWLYNRIVFSNIKINYIQFYSDLHFKEILIMLPLFFIILVFGIYPNAII